ncbi:MAG: GNAT family N-acetyltransferase [Cyclobacteriaceae bacterium]|nr:GNAT family N-acetyltransferase [Cyclobacteriaceae bacterium]MDH4295363.1 GNAT family N-acetyltransferase [Cyclobacteriaceae bacterium]MDH5247464.1 GNAT family N-acetyltransferase [Cyclobacteriaceae bacterium]
MISVQKAIQQHIDILVDFQQRLAFETENVILDAGTLRKGMKALFDDPSKGVYYVVKEESEIIGCHMITYEWSDWRNGTVWWLQSVYVQESHRKRGVFKMMYDNLITIIKNDPQLVGLRLYADKTNERALKVYEAMGMNGSHYTVFEWMK